jgi:hypothetical protein
VIASNPAQNLLLQPFMGKHWAEGLKSRWRPITAWRTRMRGLARRKYPWALSPARAAPKGYRV